jgi:hypothetical protein
MQAQAPAHTLGTLKQTLFFSPHLKFKFKNLNFTERVIQPDVYFHSCAFFPFLQVRHWYMYVNKVIFIIYYYYYDITLK